MSTDLDSTKYISFVSYKKDGTPVAAPVWVVPFEGGYAFTTEPTAWKVKRVLRNPNVTVQACNVRGKVKPGAPLHHGTAEVLDEAAMLRVRQAVKAKYRLAYVLLIAWGERKAKRTHGSATAATGAIKVTLS